MVKWTKEQEQAIYTEGSDVLVAAAAGSGKTAVLVERVIQKLLNDDHPVDIDSLLVVTFTNAAAQEMRNRIGLALEKALAENPTSLHLKKQLSLLQKSSISTLHSFCLEIVKQYAYLLDIDPGFRIANDMEADLLQQEVMEDLLEEWYGAEKEEQQRFFEVVDRFSNDRSDRGIEDLILKLYTFAMQNPWPDVWLDELAEVYHVPESWTEDDLPWLSIMKREVAHQLQAMKQELERASVIARESDGPYHYLEAIESDEKMVHEALAHLDDWPGLQEVMNAGKFQNLSRKRMDCDDEKKAHVQALRNRYKKRWNDMKKDWFSRNLTNHVEDMRKLAPVIQQLGELVKQFKDRFTRQKQEQGIVDFSDLEHYCLQLLIDKSSTMDHLVPSNVAMNLKSRYKELLVDEYQDINLVQETLLTLISDQIGSGNMFMVGDVKQSIYRFRHAEPTLFIDKYKRFSDSESSAQRIDLARNFRSREEVLTGTNYIFRQILDEELGEIEYDQHAELIYANKMYDQYPREDSHPELVIIDREQSEQKERLSNTDEENGEDLEKAQLEARVYAEKIKGWLGHKDTEAMKIVDPVTEIERDVQYRDIAILLRSMNEAPTIVEELKQQGIPVHAELSSGYFEAIEIKVMLSLLKVIDNPYQDISLAAVLRSPIVRLNEEELARIRLADRKHSFYSALRQFVKDNNDEAAAKVRRFLEQLDRFRVASRQGALSELIWQIYRETGYYDFAGGMPGGRQRQANLRALYDRARTYETTSFRGLFRFLRFIEQMEERGEDLGTAKALSEQEDVVRIMTIHSSKGLEFPIVIVGAMNKEFHMRDLSNRYLLHKDFGFASKYIDPVKRIEYPTLFYHAVKNEMRRESLAEEMRILYVALTRAKEKLVMVGNVPSFDKKQKNWQEIANHPKWVFPAYDRASAKSYLDWVIPALMRHEDNRVLTTDVMDQSVPEEIRKDPSRWKVHVIHESELTNLDKYETEINHSVKEHIENWQTLSLEDERLQRFVDKRLSYRYPYEEATKTRAKQTVTEIKRQQETKDEYSSTQLVQPFRSPIMKRPAFMQKEKTISAADRGTAMHTVMQHIPFTHKITYPEIEEFLEQLVDQEILRRDEANIIDIDAIENFFATDIAEYMIACPTIYREIPFSLTLSAQEVYSTWKGNYDEQVLIQGVLDCVIPKDDGWLILDYKTDVIDEEVTEETVNKFAERYEVQLNLYRTALERIWKEPVKETYLYFFDKQLLVNVPFQKLSAP
ncbi:MAG TPA: helicase-exonuclease AddAB subunit AddA [Bacillota bacterium]|nr:helicase-exonuclease AddAB subunit AddA [Bacillota bacterium]